MKRLFIVNNYPFEIADFFQDVFKIYEIRGQVGTYNGIKFVVHSNEKNHSKPHIHAEYAEYSIEVEIESGKVLSGNLPRKQQNIAVRWVKEHEHQLINEWNKLAISAISHYTKSALELQGEIDE